ncbi:MAG: transposase [Chloroflexota bacterium]
MSKKRKQYTKEFKLEALEKWESSDKSAADVESELGLGKGQLYRWKSALKKQAEKAESSVTEAAETVKEAVASTATAAADAVKETANAATAENKQSEADAIKAALGDLKARVEEIKAKSPKFSPSDYSPEKLLNWIKENLANFNLPIIDELREKLSQATAEDFRNPETWKEIWAIVSHHLQQEASNAMAKADEMVQPAISKAKEQLDGVPTLGEARQQLEEIDVVKNAKAFVEGLPGVKEGTEIVNQLPGAATLNSLGKAVESTAPKDFLDSKTWEGFWTVVNDSLQKEMTKFRGDDSEEEIIVVKGD